MLNDGNQEMTQMEERQLRGKKKKKKGIKELTGTDSIIRTT